MQTVLNLIYPPHCVFCETQISDSVGLCGSCWRDTPFITGLSCDKCGCPLPGQSDRAELCDDCMRLARPWSKGRAALVYKDRGRRLVLSLKHGDRLDFVKAAAHWMHKAAADLTYDIIVPVPVHWTRLVRRRFNQAAVLALAMGRLDGRNAVPDGLVRTRKTPVQDNLGVSERYANLAGAIRPHAKKGAKLQGKSVLLVDDVMTSGATLASATEACLAGGAVDVATVTLARVVKDA